MNLPNVSLLLLNLSDCISLADGWHKDASDPERCFREGIAVSFHLFIYLFFLLLSIA